MRLTYINTYNDYDKLLKFQLLKVEKRKYIFAYLFTPITLITLYFWSKNQAFLKPPILIYCIIAHFLLSFLITKLFYTKIKSIIMKLLKSS